MIVVVATCGCTGAVTSPPPTPPPVAPPPPLPIALNAFAVATIEAAIFNPAETLFAVASAVAKATPPGKAAYFNLAAAFAAFVLVTIF